MNFRIKYITLILLSLTVTSFAQNNTSSPYSKFGIGDLGNVAFGKSIGLGGAGIGIRDPQFLNLRNPASLTSIDSLAFLFETGVHIQITNATNSVGSEKYYDGNITHLIFGHRYNNRFMTCMGILPLTNIGYDIITTKDVENEVGKVQTEWVGDGGINKMFYSLGMKLDKNFSIGGEAAFIYGPINESRQTSASTLQYSPTVSYSNARYSGFTFKGGFQYNAKLGINNILTIGGTYSPSRALTGVADVKIYQQYAGTTINDSVFSQNDMTVTSLHVPETYGTGFSFIYKRRYMVAADYEAALWGNLNTTGLINQSIYSVGFERMPLLSLKYLDRCSYRVGFRYDSGYIKAKGATINDVRFTLGAGFPIKKSGSVVNVSFEAGQRGTESSGLIKEKYAKMTVALSFFDFWFGKRKFD